MAERARSLLSQTAPRGRGLDEPNGRLSITAAEKGF